MKINYFILAFSVFTFTACAEENSSETTDETVITTENGSESEEIVVTEISNEESDPTIQKMNPIDEYVDELDSKKEWDDQLTLEMLESTEGGELKVYFDGEYVSKITEHHLGEMGQKLNVYYLKDESLVFVKETEISYNAPFYMEGEFDPAQMDTMSNYSYFDNDQLFRRFEDGDCGAPFADDYKLEEQKRILTRLDELMAYLTK